ncbi:MAG TPA: hypothetical protein ENH03_00660 [Candidatus Bathyarchaeota archaeon]|nr:hypothetical protein [Candidatus Bathyarchaeota archaeon]
MLSYEYIFAAIIVFAILIASAMLASILPQLTLNISDIQQLKMVAQKIMTQLTLNPGSPPEWGSNITIGPNDLTAFGLAEYREFVRAAYILDPDKVQRLNSRGVPSPLYMPPSRVIELFNLGHDYGLKLEFIPALNVNVNVQQSSISVSVFSEQGMPIADANVAARVFYLQGGQINRTSLILNYTDIDGQCNLKFNNLSPDALIVLLVDYNGVCVVKTRILGSFSKSYFIGNNLILNNSLTVQNNTAYQVIAFKSGENYVIDNVSYSLTQTSSPLLSNYRVYNMTYTEPYAIALLAVTNEGELVIACKIVPSSYSSISGEVYPPMAYTLEKSVKIGQSLYTLRLQIWRMSW